MPRFPYMNFPFPYYNKPSPFPASTPLHKVSTHSSLDCNEPLSSTSSTTYTTSTTISNHNRLITQKNKSNISNNDYLFDLFGLKIYTDDVLLISLIYFLYSEGVKDEGLFIVLILLLLS